MNPQVYLYIFLGSAGQLRLPSVMHPLQLVLLDIVRHPRQTGQRVPAFRGEGGPRSHGDPVGDELAHFLGWRS